jgi:hypothetical protein
MKTINDQHVARGSRQQSSREQSAGNGNHTEEIQQGLAPVPSNIRNTSEKGKNIINGSHGAKRK